MDKHLQYPDPTAHWAIPEATMRVLVTRADAAVAQGLTFDAPPERPPFIKAGNAAIIPIQGVLASQENLFTFLFGGSTYPQISAGVRAAVADQSVAKIILLTDSPGGEVQGAADLSRLIFDARQEKPIEAFVSGMALSAAYWLVSAADRIITTKTALMGNLGAIMHIHRGDDDSVTLVSSQTPAKDPTDKQIIEVLTAIAEVFLDDVARNRGVTRATVDADFGQGAVIVGKDAVQAGLSDGINTIQAVMDAVQAPRQTLSAAAFAGWAFSDQLEEALAAQITTATTTAAQPDFSHAPTVAVHAGPSEPTPTEAHLDPNPQAAEPPADPQAAPTPYPAGSGAPADPTVHGRWVETPGAIPKEDLDEILLIAAENPDYGQANLQRWLTECKTPKAVREDLNRLYREGNAAPTPAINPMDNVSARERKPYNLGGAILAQAQTMLGERPSYDWGYERELHEEASRNAFGDVRGFLLPTNAGATPLNGPMSFYGPEARRIRQDWDMRAQLRADTATDGAELVFTEPGEFIELLRNRIIALELGVQLLDNLVGPVGFPRQTSAASGSWVAEDPGSDVADSLLQLDTVTLTPTTYQASTSYTRQLLAQSLRSVNVEVLVRTDMARVHALAVDLAVFHGTGASNQPTGIVNQTGVATVAIGTNGGAPTYDHMIQLEEEVAVDNAELASIAYVTNAKARSKLKRTEKFSGTNGNPVWEVGGIQGLRSEMSNQIASNLTKGSGTSLSAIFYGAFSQGMLGQWNAFDVVVDPFRLKKQGLIETTSFQMVDFQVRHGEAFSMVVDADTT